MKLENIKFWYDEYEIGWGESVLRKINQGLEKSKFAIVVLSKSFLNKKWTNAELEAVLNIETNTGDVRVLPLMLGDSNDIKEILSHYPLLSAKRYLKVSDGTDLIIENLKKVLYK
ncbi:toll/interleukin-1 receptor domain-containing protein [Chryseobacterium sp. CFBP8996]|uniref:toll/interleukin-1 receptor domain-containing protein n=1 Tax=Chryseobacterium sp. CFBP8996 TaxID=3096529 RepID=UPI002A6AC757|nr:toll/interleukin-1 receptor domain-containing protein [Chryseobacterium sp. CFBP8996]MDY0930729.1 toll/interleukin-1 receptor domain-containing protein [Chryseobacterium sp. CFBP8996]